MLEISVAALFLISLSSAAISSNACPPSTLFVRLPPYINPAINETDDSSSLPPNNQTYLAPPASFYSGTWYLANTSSTAYRALFNLQWDLHPVLPSCDYNTASSCPSGTLSGAMADLTTWAIQASPGNASGNAYDFGAFGGGGRHVSSIFGFDTPRRLTHPNLSSDWDGVFDINVSGAFSSGYSEAWAVLFWGLDIEGTPFMVVHEDNGSTMNSPPCLDVWTRDRAGPDAVSLAKVTHALLQLRSADLTDMVDKLAPVSWNGSLPGGPAICGTDCQANRAR